jgi:hypothetical protein
MRSGPPLAAAHARISAVPRGMGIRQRAHWTFFGGLVAGGCIVPILYCMILAPPD